MKPPITEAAVITYAKNRAQAAMAANTGGSVDRVYTYKDPGEADSRAKAAMHNAMSAMPTMARAYANHVPAPARAKTRGMVKVGEVLGAMVETDWASVSKGDSTFCLNP
jgi:hypothetical protein